MPPPRLLGGPATGSARGPRPGAHGAGRGVPDRNGGRRLGETSGTASPERTGVDAPGGVRYAAEAIAGQWDSMWGFLVGDRPPTEVSATSPDDGERRIPATGWVRTYQPGSHPGRGGARTRIAASLTYSLPYVPAGGGPSVPAQLPDGAMTLTAVDTEEPVPLMAGFPRAVPYGPDAGEHTVGLQPAVDLVPCSWYRVEVTAALLDADGAPVVPTSWTFRTGVDGAGRRCPDDPFTPDELYLRAAYRHLLDREAEPAGLEAWTDRMDRGLTPSRFSPAVVGSAEHRQRLVREMYQAYLGRAPEQAGRDHWAERLASRRLTEVRAQVLGSAELAALAGGTTDGYVRALYHRVLGRAPEQAGLDHWRAALAAGVPRTRLATLLLTSTEATTTRVADAYVALLGRSPEPAALAHWGPRVRAADERVVVTAIVASPEYVTRAQVP